MGHARGNTNLFGDKENWNFAKKSLLTCVKKSEQTHNVCDKSTWITFILEEDRDTEKGIYPEMESFDVNYLNIPK